MRARRLAQRVGCILAGTALAASTALGTTATPASASGWTAGGFSARLIYDMNAARAHYGLPPLRQLYGMWTISVYWSGHMEKTHVLAHDPYLVSLTNVRCPHWTLLGENVGYGYNQDPDALFRAYWNSAAHRANILGRSYRYVGVSAAFSGSTAWNTVDFVNAC